LAEKSEESVLGRRLAIPHSAIDGPTVGNLAKKDEKNPQPIFWGSICFPSAFMSL
jgi:hypothetical protein